MKWSVALAEVFLTLSEVSEKNEPRKGGGEARAIFQRALGKPPGLSDALSVTYKRLDHR